MKYQPALFEQFISPITGKWRSYTQFPFLDEDYIILGNPQEDAVPSPALIDVRLDVIQIKTILEKIKSAKFILQKAESVLANAQALDVLSNGFLYKNENGILSTQIPGGGSLALPWGQVYIGGEDGLAQSRILLPKQMIIGGSESRAELVTSLFLENMANLTGKKIWRGNITTNRPEESDDLTNVENSIGGILTDLSNLANVVSSISNAVSALTSTVAAIETTVASLVVLIATVATLVTTVAALGTAISLLRNLVNSINVQGFVTGHIDDYGNIVTSRGPNCTLDVIPAAGDVSFGNYKATLIKDPEAPQDAVNLKTLESAVSGAIDNIALDGFVKGASNESGEIHTTRGPDCLLKNIPAGGNVSMDNYKINNLVSDDLEQFDAVNSNFLWDLMHDNVGVVYI